jgi:hypothetical protein
MRGVHECVYECVPDAVAQQLHIHDWPLRIADSHSQVVRTQHIVIGCSGVTTEHPKELGVQSWGGVLGPHPIVVPV